MSEENDVAQKQINQDKPTDEELRRYIMQSTGMTMRQYKQHLKTVTQKAEKRRRRK